MYYKRLARYKVVSTRYSRQSAPALSRSSSLTHFYVGRPGDLLSSLPFLSLLQKNLTGSSMSDHGPCERCLKAGAHHSQSEAWGQRVMYNQEGTHPPPPKKISLDQVSGAQNCFKMCLRPEAFTALPRPLAGLQWFTFKARQGSESVTQTQIYDYTCMQWAGASQHSQGTETMVGG